MKAIPKRTFLLRQEPVEGRRRKKDVVAFKGVVIDVTNDEASKFASDLILKKK